jgi:hypothetical protein
MRIIATPKKECFIVEINSTEKHLLELQQKAGVKKAVRLAMEKMSEANTALISATRSSLEYWNQAYPKSAMEGTFKDVVITAPIRKSKSKMGKGRKR